MTTTGPAFFVAGGTLPPDAPSYIPRRADDELLDGLLAGEFCYVLTSRQMGKSSLMVRTAARLRQSGVRVAALDLTAIGRNLSPDRWYYAVLLELGCALDQEELVDATWNDVSAQAPLHGFLRTLRKLIHADPDKSVVIFVDEIDYVRSLPFSVDEFFAAVRACYNERAADSAWNRLTFCLLGVAGPGDLIRDARVTPFNIGHAVRLQDFTAQDVTPLGRRLPGSGDHADKAMGRVLHWTGGHHYLTQKLLRSLAESSRALDDGAVDEACWRLFLEPRERDIDSNLLFVRDTLLNSQTDLVACLDLYTRVIRGKRVPNVESDRASSVLRLTGIVKVASGLLSPRNKIYERVFDRRWTAEQTPNALVRKQRSAYLRGVFRTASLFTMALSLVLGLLIWSLSATREARSSAQRARIAAFNASRESARADLEAGNARQLLYYADMLQAPQAWDTGNLLRLNQLLEETRSNENRGFEWDYWNRLARLDIPVAWDVRPADGTVTAVSREGAWALRKSEIGWTLVNAPDETHISVRSIHLESSGEAFPNSIFVQGHFLATAGSRALRTSIWDTRTGDRLSETGASGCSDMQFSADGSRIGCRDLTRLICIFDTRSGRLIHRQGRMSPISETTGFALSPASDRTAIMSADGTVLIWDGSKPVALLKSHIQGGSALAYSPDGRLLATCGEDSTLVLWSLPSGRRLKIARLSERIYMAAFSADGKRIATAGESGALRIWDAGTLKQLVWLRGHEHAVKDVVFTRDGQRVISRDESGQVKLWRAGASDDFLNIRAHRHYGIAAMFVPDGQDVVTVGGDLTARVWDSGSGALVSTLRGHTGDLYAAAVSPDGRRIVTGSEDCSARIWDRRRGGLIRILRGHSGRVNAVAYSPDGSRIVTGGEDYNVILWDAGTGARIAVYPFGARIWRLVVSPNGSDVAVGGLAGHVDVWRIADNKLDRSLAIPGALTSIAYSPDGKFIASCDGQRVAIVWDAATGAVARRFLGHAGVVDVDFSPDGQRLLTAGLDGASKLWDTRTGREVLTIKGPPYRLATARFSRDGARIVTCCADGTVRIYSAAPRLHTSGVSSPGSN